MKITQIRLFRYRLPLRQPLILRAGTLTERAGLLVQVTADESRSAWGEVAPLPGFSRETLPEAERQLRELRAGLTGAPIPTGLEKLDGGFGNWLGHGHLLPSVTVGIETAILQLLAQAAGTSVRHLICANPRQSVAVNALLDGSEEDIRTRAARCAADGFTTFKLKIGRHSLDDDVRLVQHVRTAVGSKARIRLDANRMLDTASALRFGDAVQRYDIEYIEEPVPEFLALLQLTNRGGFRLPVALDESLQTISPKALTQMRGVRAVILKPTLLGLEWSMWFARRAQRVGMLAVISSTYESSLTLAILAEIGACLNGAAPGEDVAMGLDTADIFSHDLVDPPLHIERGRIILPPAHPAPADLPWTSLEELTHA